MSALQLFTNINSAMINNNNLEELTAELRIVVVVVGAYIYTA